MDRLERLRQTRAATFSKLEGVIDTAEKRDGMWGDADQEQYDEHKEKLDVVNARINDIEEHEAREAELAEARQNMPDGIRPDPAGSSGSGSEHRAGANVPLPSWREYRQLEARALSEGTASAGGFLVPESWSNSWYDMLRAQSVVLSARPSPVVLEMTTDTLHVPKIASSVTSSMVAENAIIPQGDPTFGESLLQPKNAAAFSLVSNQALDDSSPALREVLARDFMASLASLVDLQFLAGSGAGSNMRGLRNIAGPTSTSLGANGATPTLDDLANAIGRMQGSNASPTHFVMHSRTFSTLRRTKDSQLRYQMSPDPTAEPTHSLFGVPVLLSNQISVADTVGTSSDTSYVLLVDMSQVVIGRRQEIAIEYSRDFAFNANQTAVRGFARMDIGLLTNGGLEIITGVRP